LSIPIRHQTYFNYFAISNEAKAAASASKNVSFFNVIAPLLLYDKMHIDLVTEERKLKVEIELKGRRIVRTAVLVMMVLFLGFALLASKVHFRTTYLKGITARYQPFRDEAKDLEKVFEKTQVVRNYLLKRGKSLEVMAGLYDALPPDVRLASVRYEDGERFSIKGTSTTMSSVFTLITNLEKSKSKLFTNVKTKYVTSRTEAGVDLADFEIVSDVQIEKAAS
jgi:Tfp pilus assembly protein PilN